MAWLVRQKHMASASAAPSARPRRSLARRDAKKEPWPQSCWMINRRTSRKTAGTTSGNISQECAPRAVNQSRHEEQKRQPGIEKLHHGAPVVGVGVRRHDLPPRARGRQGRRPVSARAALHRLRIAAGAGPAGRNAVRECCPGEFQAVGRYRDAGAHPLLQCNQFIDRLIRDCLLSAASVNHRRNAAGCPPRSRHQIGGHKVTGWAVPERY